MISCWFYFIFSLVMLTPKFCIDQDSVTVIVSITVPHVRVVGNMEVYVDGKIFSFYCKPYLLKLVFPHEIISPEDEIDVDGLTSHNLGSLFSDTYKYLPAIERAKDSMSLMQSFNDLRILGKMYATLDRSTEEEGWRRPGAPIIASKIGVITV